MPEGDDRLVWEVARRPRFQASVVAPMRLSLVPLSLFLAGALSAQNCPDGDLGVLLASNVQDVVLPIQSIGFAFPVGATTYTDLHITDHGFVQLSNGGVPAPAAGSVLYTPTPANFMAGSAKVAAMYADVTATSGEIWLKSTPTRTVVTWKNLLTFGSTGPFFDIQLVLEPNGFATAYYGPGTINNSTFGGVSDNAITGVSPGGGGVAPASLDLSLGGVSATNATYELFAAAGTFDMASNSLLLAGLNPGYSYVLLGAPANCASASSYGTGCLSVSDSIYEFFPTAATNDLSGSAISWFFGGGTYTMISPIVGSIVPVGPGATNVAPSLLDGQTSFTLSSPMPGPGGTVATLNVTTKGQVELTGPTTLIDFTPTPAEFVTRANATFCCWADWDQTDPGSGSIWFEEVAGVAYVTWDNVHHFSAAAPSRFQFQFDLATGAVTLVFGTMDTTNPGALLVGYTGAGGVVDPGSSDLSTIGSAVVSTVEVQAMAMDAVGVPSLGNAGFGFNATNVPQLLPVGFIFFGDVVINPGVDLTFIGMAGCNAYSNANIGTFSFPAIGGSGFAPLPIPNNPAFVGATLSAQTLGLSTLTALNLVASNGVQFTVGF